MSADKEHETILATENGQELVQCQQCLGDEGHVDDNDEWVDCAACGGEGAFWRPVKSLPEQKT